MCKADLSHSVSSPSRSQVMLLRPQVNKGTLTRQDIPRAGVLLPGVGQRLTLSLECAEFGQWRPPEFILYCTVRMMNNPGLMTLGVETSETGHRYTSEGLAISRISLDHQSQYIALIIAIKNQQGERGGGRKGKMALNKGKVTEDHERPVKVCLHPRAGILEGKREIGSSLKKLGSG